MVAAYTARGASGFGAAVAMPLLALVVPLKILCRPGPYRHRRGRRADRRGPQARRLERDGQARSGLLVGIAVGLYVFTRLSSETLALWLGVAVLLYGLYSLAGTFRADLKAKLPPWIAPVFGGFGGGITGTVVGTMGSVFFAMYFDAIRLPRSNTAPP